MQRMRGVADIFRLYWMIIIGCCCLCTACSTREDADAANIGTETLTDVSENILLQTDENAEQNAQEENQPANISENTTDTDSSALEEADHREDQDIEENYLIQISDKVDEKAEPYIDTYVSLTDDTEIEYCEWMEYGEEQVLRVAIQYKEQPENAYRHKKDYFLFITQNGDVSNIIEENYEDKYIAAACGFDAHFEDVTFDGEEDLLIFMGYAGNGSTFYCAYIYENGEFRYERTFEEIPCYAVDTEEELIYGSNRESWNSYSDRTYQYIDGKFVLAEEIVSSYKDINGESVLTEDIIYSYEYINGESVLTETTEYPLNE